MNFATRSLALAQSTKNTKIKIKFARFANGQLTKIVCKIDKNWKK